ncbi:hypothetical protein, partial [Flavobacterium sp.]|uniref:hypothetical protein n=1 Tax=Flavobacterium sp. TaxID=239 RepID=UPI00286EAF07
LLVCQDFYELVRQCGCKSSLFIQLYKAFLNLFLKYFLSYWFFDIYKDDFLNIFGNFQLEYYKEKIISLIIYSFELKNTNEIITL